MKVGDRIRVKPECSILAGREGVILDFDMFLRFPILAQIDGETMQDALYISEVEVIES